MHETADLLTSEMRCLLGQGTNSYSYNQQMQLSVLVGIQSHIDFSTETKSRIRSVVGFYKDFTLCSLFFLM